VTEPRKLNELLLKGAAGALTTNQTCQDMACSKFFSFAEVVQGRDANARITDDGLLHAVDVNMVMSGKDRNNAGRDLRDLSDDVFSSTKFVERKMPGKGNGHTKLVSFENAIELIMVLPGKVAKETRAKFASIIRRYLAGDHSLIVEIKANAESDSPIAKLARGEAPITEDPDSRRKRLKREDLELIRMEEEIIEKRASTKRLQIQNVQSFMDLMTDIRPDWKQTDARFRLQTEDIIKNIMVTPVGLALTDGKRDSASLSISQLVLELGGKPLKHADACRAGALAAKRYREVHDADPPKHAQWVDGAERSVNSYTEADRGLLTAVLTDLDLVQARRI
jgi:hypothetical protein